jgi:teichoic acid transport system permease protein
VPAAVPDAGVSPSHADLADLAARHELTKLGSRPALPTYLRQLWGRRYFCFGLARARFRSANEQDRLGIAWVVLRPLINAAVYGFVFGLLLPQSSKQDNFIASLVVAVFIFQYFAGCLTDGAKSITGNSGLIKSLHFPRAVLPLATVVEQLLQLIPMIVVMVVVAVATGEPPRVHWLQMVPALVLMTLFCSGIAMMAARLTIHIRDITQLIPFITRLVFYLSGIFYKTPDASATGGQGVLADLLFYNPVHVYIRLVRGALIESEQAPAGTWQLAVGYGVVFFVLGFLYFWRAEERYGRE